MASPLIIHKGAEFSTTALRRTAACDGGAVVAIPSGFEARMIFSLQYGPMTEVFTLTSDPAAGLTIDYAHGMISIYYGATQTAALTAGIALTWVLEIYDPLNADAVIFLGSGTAVVQDP